MREIIIICLLLVLITAVIVGIMVVLDDLEEIKGQYREILRRLKK